jgi:RNA polymerase sigma factor (sigma-70 family)
MTGMAWEATEADDPALKTKSGLVSFEEFVGAEHARLFRALYLVTGSRQEAEEIMQDAFLALWERWDRVGSMEDPTGYLFRTAMNIFRKRVRRALLALRRTVALAPQEDPYEAVDSRQIVFAALKTLHPKARAAIVLTSLEGYTSEEAAAMLGTSAGVVRALASRARAAIKQAVGEQQ